MRFNGVKKLLAGKQSPRLHNLVGVPANDGRGEIERHTEMDAIVMCSTGSGDGAEMFAVQLTAVERVRNRTETVRQIGIESFRNRFRQE